MKCKSCLNGVRDRLRLMTYDLYHQIGKAKVWSLKNDELCDEIENYINERINQIFDDEMQKL